VEESSSCHPRDFRQMKSDFKNMLSVFLNSEAILQKEFFPSVLACESIVLHGSTKGFMEAAGRKCPTDGVHRTGCCIMKTCCVTQIHGFFRCLTKRRWWWYLASILLHTSWLILVLKCRNVVKGMKI